MAKFRIDIIGDLARQMSFTPQETRGAQLAAAEVLLFELQPCKAYPLEFIVFRITGYRPKSVDAPLLTGLALQHDLGLLIEQVSLTLNLRAEAATQAVLTIDEVTERFNVTSKTIQRWRRRGLAARHFVFPDGKRRVGFFAGTIERFLANHRDQALASVNFSEVSDDERAAILRNARRLVVRSGCCQAEISRRIARHFDRSTLTVDHVIRDHDLANPQSAILPLAALAVGSEQREQIMREYRRDLPLIDISKSIGLSRSAIYRVIILERLARFSRRKVRFIDDPLYHQHDAAGVIDQIVAQEELPARPRAEESRVPRDLPAYLQDLYRTPLLSPTRERALFLKHNFIKFQFVTARRRLDPQLARGRALAVLESIRRDLAESKNQIVRANLRLVVSVARKHLRPGLPLMELISDGNLTLMRAVDSFDFHKGYRFSTYATLALMKGFARSVPRMQAQVHSSSHNADMLSSLSDGRQSQAMLQLLHREHLQKLLLCLEPRERDVILAHFGLREDAPATLEQVGSRLGLTKQRVRQIEQVALAKLRANDLEIQPNS
ncbi:MAG: sigma-70 family RNA polymerase sigma factor [Planctomycetota bacterium]|nr:sigma-70 family RNA polymerase sigma factor [Planctomycetota bacterium]